MQRIRYMVALLTTCVLHTPLLADGPCDAALVKSTYNSFSQDTLDWRLALSVTESEYNEIKHDAGVNAIIYGFPVGASYDDFQTRVRNATKNLSESLSTNQIRNILWTGLDPNSVSPYVQCLQSQVFSSRGLHLAVKAATATDISLLVAWTPQMKDPATIKIKWSKGFETLPTKVTQGVTPVVIDRPKAERTIAVSHPGTGDSVTIEPLPIRVTEPPLIVEPAQVYRSDSLPSGACKDFSGWYSLCSPDKPTGWQIHHREFHLEGDRSCGAWSNCEVTSDGTTKVCYRFQMQGHDEECSIWHSSNTGVHNSTGVLTVIWTHH